MVFNVVPTAFEVALVGGILAYKCGPAFAVLTAGTIAAYTAFTFSITQARECGAGWALHHASRFCSWGGGWSWGFSSCGQVHEEIQQSSPLNNEHTMRTRACCCFLSLQAAVGHLATARSLPCWVQLCHPTSR